jgi:hypothetical protein
MPQMLSVSSVFRHSNACQFLPYSCTNRPVDHPVTLVAGFFASVCSHVAIPREPRECVSGSSCAETTQLISCATFFHNQCQHCKRKRLKFVAMVSWPSPRPRWIRKASERHHSNTCSVMQLTRVLRITSNNSSFLASLASNPTPCWPFGASCHHPVLQDCGAGTAFCTRSLKWLHASEYTGT